MKIDYVTIQFPVWPEAFAINDVCTLHKKGVDVSVHSLRSRHESAPGLIRERNLDEIPMSWFGLLTVLRLPWLTIRRFPVLMFLIATVVRHNLTSPKHLFKGLLSVPRSLEIVARLMSSRPDAVHLFWGHYPALVGLAVKRFLPGTTLTLFLGAYDLLWGYGCTPHAARAADVIFTHARSNLPAIEALGADMDRVRVVYRGVDPDQWKQEINQRKRPFSIATAGKLVPEKRFDAVIDAAAALIREFPDLSLTVVGDGPERERLAERAVKQGLRKRVHFTGAVPHRRVFRELGRADLFLFLSKNPSERLPNVIKEAIACRCVPVVSRTDGIEELIPDRDHGVVVDSPEDAIREIRGLWADDHRREEMRERAMEHLKRNFDLDSTMQDYITEWESNR